MRYNILIISLLTIQILSLKAQNIECIGNEIVLPLNGYKGGNIQWQFSTNGNHWNNIAESNTNELTYTIIETGYFRAKVIYGNCEYYSDSTYIQALPKPTLAEAGIERIINNGSNSVTLSANIPNAGVGKWTIVTGSGGNFANSNLSNTTFSGIIGNKYTLRWSITSCSQSSDEVNIWFVDTSSVNYFGDIYHTIVIGNQQWMVENLKTTKFSNGDNILTTDPPTLDISGESTPKYQWSNRSDDIYVPTYGRLYTWHTAMDNRNVCPSGWHVPSVAEWTILTNYLGGSGIAGGSLKETGTEHWTSPNNGANNFSGFTALPGGYRSSNGWFKTDGGSGWYWTSGITGSHAWCWYLEYNSTIVLQTNSSMKDALSIRCLKD